MVAVNVKKVLICLGVVTLLWCTSMVLNTGKLDEMQGSGVAFLPRNGGEDGTHANKLVGTRGEGKIGNFRRGHINAVKKECSFDSLPDLPAGVLWNTCNQENGLKNNETCELSCDTATYSQLGDLTKGICLSGLLTLPTITCKAKCLFTDAFFLDQGVLWNTCVQADGLKHGEFCELACDPNTHEQEGSGTAGKCEDGSWITAPRISCFPKINQEKVCKIALPSHSSAGTCLLNGTLREGETCMPKCDDGFLDSAVLACKNGILSRTDCAPKPHCTVVLPPETLAGNCGDMLLSGDTCKPSCREDYMPNSAELSCIAGVLKTIECIPKPGCVVKLPLHSSRGTCGDTLKSGRECKPECGEKYVEDSAVLSCFEGALTTTECSKPSLVTDDNAVDPNLFRSTATIKKIWNGKSSDESVFRRYHGWLGINAISEVPLFETIPLSKPISAWTDEEVEKAHHGYQFNRNASDSFPMDREYGKGWAPEQCNNVVKAAKRGTTMAPASIIFVFHGEYFTTLLRSVHSILNKTPPEYLKEIIMVDDGSDLAQKPWLDDQLREYIKTLPKIVYKRMPQRVGLMRARMAGSDLASGDNLIFLDSHIEAADNWIEPLLGFLHEDYRNVGVPNIDSISPETFEQKEKGIGILAFSWDLKQRGITRKESAYENIDSPIMAGGLFAITKKWFFELERYDKELQHWGGEEDEISFKIWMCGGRLNLVPCSHVGHVFRDTKHTKSTAYEINWEFVKRNKQRVAAVWMHPYESINKFFSGDLEKGMTIGDLTGPLALKDKLQCKNFDWYMKNVFPELVVPEFKGAHIGELVISDGTNQCLDTMQAKNAGDHVGFFACHGQKGTQAYLLSGTGDLMTSISARTGPACVTVSEDKKDSLKLKACDKTTAWKFEDGRMRHKYSNNCMTMIKRKFSMKPCGANQGEGQKWMWRGPSSEDFLRGN